MNNLEPVNSVKNEKENLQDQYREEEIEEFRELQRELEQNAKNCRILQFKLRKAERMKEQIETEKQHLNAKVKVLIALYYLTSSQFISYIFEF